MKHKVITMAFLMVISVASNAEVCVINDTGHGENVFIWAPVKKVVIDWTQPAHPVMSSSDTIEIHTIQDRGTECVNGAAGSGEVSALFRVRPPKGSPEDLRKEAVVWAPKQGPTTVGEGEGIIYYVKQKPSGNLIVLSRKNGGPYVAVPYEKVFRARSSSK